jgi:3-oxoacyl-[acyl-carrier-protein] synthase-3
VTRRPVLLNAPRYVLGETEVHHADLPGFAARAAELRMAPNPALWGWGSVRRTARDLTDLAVRVGRSVLDGAGLTPAEVDAVVLCSTRFPGGAETHGRFVELIMTGLDLPGAAFTGVTLNRCTNLLAALDLAEALVSSGRHRRVLVLSTDRVDDESTRLQPFALFSDGAAGCLVAADGHGEHTYDILGCANAQDNRSLDWSNEISAELSRTVAEALLKPVGLAQADLDALLHPNLFVPVVVMKERLAGFTAEQVWTGNVTRVGHCFAADPLINLVDRVAAGHVRPGGHVILGASVPGSRHGVLLRVND